MLERLALRNSSLLAEVLPQVGGGLARLDWLGEGGQAPLLRGLPHDVADLPIPSQLACFPLLPWSNRMAPSGFQFEGRRHVPAPNRAGEPCPIHGDAWQQPWQVASHFDTSLVLTLDRTSAAPFAYSAELCYTLVDDALVLELAVCNAGEVALPFGIGLHPWLPDPQGARLTAGANSVWMAGPDKLPVVRQDIPSHWRFNVPAPLPQDGVDHVFEGWHGAARIAWPARGLALELQADMDYFILYVPPGRDFFCFEPVDHPINAHNLPGYPGLTVLAPGATLRRRCAFRGMAL
ncbi:aldose 1-epimerase [Massilia yuzhufengensis]|uniref:Aldose 1-epimerase n=1 Tax=Massilia yuzhufengensis TaxID=1164594 RepID=A0A1I1RDU6_9BURK|nr:aldose 1-epimerase [Massilia yuzhufengensis]SFD32556.1 aldose 1-epimerase [Massilia yuzhufengensis]